MFEALPRRGMGVQGRPRLDRGPVLGNGDSISDGPDAISSSTCTIPKLVGNVSFRSTDGERSCLVTMIDGVISCMACHTSAAVFIRLFSCQQWPALNKALEL